MPHTKSAKKSLRKTEKRNLRNRAQKKVLRVQTKKVLETASTGTLEQLAAEIKIATKKLDKAAAKRVVHKNTVARRKSQLAKLFNKKKAAPPAAAKS